MTSTVPYTALLLDATLTSQIVELFTGFACDLVVYLVVKLCGFPSEVRNVVFYIHYGLFFILHSAVRILIQFGMRFTHRNKAIGLPLKPAPKMYDEHMLEKESKGEIVCVMSNIWFDLYEPKELWKKKSTTTQVRVVCVCLSFLLSICRSVCACF
jgi:hypothetical protein